MTTEGAGKTFARKIIVDVDNLPLLMKGAITEDIDECGIIIDRKTGAVHFFMEDAACLIPMIDADRFREAFIMINKDF